MILLWEIVPQDAGEILVLFRRCSDWRHEHRGQKSRHEGEHRRVRPAGPVAHQKSLLPDDRCKRIDVPNREFILLGWRLAPKSLQFQCFFNFAANQARHDQPERQWQRFKELGGALTKLTSSSQRVAIRAR
jgi:hypothetical protein